MYSEKSEWRSILLPCILREVLRRLRSRCLAIRPRVYTCRHRRRDEHVFLGLVEADEVTRIAGESVEANERFDARSNYSLDYHRTACRRKRERHIQCSTRDRWWLLENVDQENDVPSSSAVHRDSCANSERYNLDQHEHCNERVNGEESVTNRVGDPVKQHNHFHRSYPRSQSWLYCCMHCIWHSTLAESDDLQPSEWSHSTRLDLHPTRWQQRYGHCMESSTIYQRYDETKESQSFWPTTCALTDE